MENIDKQNPYLSIVIDDSYARNTRGWRKLNDKAGL